MTPDVTKLMTPDITVLVALFSLGWFVIGVFIGRHLYYEKGSSRSSRSSNKSGSSHKKGSGNDYEIYVGNLPYEMDEKELEGMFGKYGKVTATRIIKNKFNGKSRGYGFVEMSDGDAVRQAVKAINGREIKGRRVVANEARSTPRD